MANETTTAGLTGGPPGMVPVYVPDSSRTVMLVYVWEDYLGNDTAPIFTYRGAYIARAHITAIFLTREEAELSVELEESVYVLSTAYILWE